MLSSVFSFVWQLLQKGTQLLSDMLDDASLSVLIDQLESVSQRKDTSVFFILMNFNFPGICVIRYEI